MLRQFIENHLLLKDPTGTSLRVVILTEPVLTGGPIKKPPRIVSFSYCPFCGTRLTDPEGKDNYNEEVMAWVASHTK